MSAQAPTPENAPQSPSPATTPPQQPAGVVWCPRCGRAAALQPAARFCIGCGQSLSLTPAVFAPSFTTTINVQGPAPVAQSAVVVVSTGQRGHGLVVRTLYFLCIGWWFGGFCLGAAVALMASVIGLPFGLLLLNRLPQIMTLRTGTGGASTTVVTHGAGTAATAAARVLPRSAAQRWGRALLITAAAVMVLLVLVSAL